MRVWGLGLVFVLACGFGYAAEEQEPKVPKEVLKTLDYFVGVWDVVVETEGEAPVKKTWKVEWSPEKHCLIHHGSGVFSSVMGWNSKSKSIVDVAFYVDGGHAMVALKVKSPDRLEGQVKGVNGEGKPTRWVQHWTKQGPNNLACKTTDEFEGDEKRPDKTVTFTRRT